MQGDLLRGVVAGAGAEFLAGYHCDVETRGELNRGQTVVDVRDNFRWRHLPRVHAARDADFPALRRFIVDTLMA